MATVYLPPVSPRLFFSRDGILKSAVYRYLLADALGASIGDNIRTTPLDPTDLVDAGGVSLPYPEDCFCIFSLGVAAANVKAVLIRDQANMGFFNYAMSQNSSTGLVTNTYSASSTDYYPVRVLQIDQPIELLTTLAAALTNTAKDFMQVSFTFNKYK
jgi:hypothetical protein